MGLLAHNGSQCLTCKWRMLCICSVHAPHPKLQPLAHMLFDMLSTIIPRYASVARFLLQGARIEQGLAVISQDLLRSGLHDQLGIREPQQSEQGEKEVLQADGKEAAERHPVSHLCQGVCQSKGEEKWTICIQIILYIQKNNNLP